MELKFPEKWLFATLLFVALCNAVLAVPNMDTTNSDSTQSASAAQDAGADDSWALHGQISNITQKHAEITAPYSSTNSLSQRGPAEETTDITLFIGKRLWQGAELWLNPEIDQGFGFNNTLGLAGFPNGAAYKLGKSAPYLRFQRLFVRQVFSLDNALTATTAAPNQFSMLQSADNLTLTIGKFSVVDVFDTNSYAHDPRADFLNWTSIESGAYDYAADPWGYTFGAALEWNQDDWTVRAGFFQLSPVPNSKIVRMNFGENSTNFELENRHVWLEHPGKIKLLVWLNQARMASYRDALAESSAVPEVASVRHYGSRPGVAFNMEQELTRDLGAFARLSANRSDKETYEFSDINQSVSTGLSLKGSGWNRPDDAIGLAIVENRISSNAQSYFAAGGLGILIGDGHLNYAPEKILEIFYSVQVTSNFTLALDYQHIANPAYNQDRGPVSIAGIRLHGSF